MTTIERNQWREEKEGFDNNVNNNEEGFVIEEQIDPEKPFWKNFQQKS